MYPAFLCKTAGLTIGICLETDEGFSKRVLCGFEDYRREHGLHDWRYYGSYQTGLTIPGKDLPNFDVDALVGCFSDSEIVKTHEQAGIPVVSLQSWGHEGTKSTRLLIDEKKIGSIAARHLLSQGYESFAYYGNQGPAWTGYKLQGFAAELKSIRGYKVQNRLLHKSVTLHWQHYEELKHWAISLPRKTAVFCWNDFYAHFLCEVALHAGLRIPQDLAIMGVNDDPFCDAISEVHITSIDLGARKIGRRLGQLLNAKIKGEIPDSHVEIHDPVCVVPRESTLRNSGATCCVTDALKYLEEHYREPININDLARKVGTSQRSLNRHFSATLATTPKAELIKLRLAKGEELLEKSQLCIASIAEAVGFADERSFVSHFRKSFGTTPAAYRKDPTLLNYNNASLGQKLI